MPAKLKTENKESYSNDLYKKLFQSFSIHRTDADLVWFLEKPLYAEAYDAAFEVLRLRGHFT